MICRAGAVDIGKKKRKKKKPKRLGVVLLSSSGGDTLRLAQLSVPAPIFMKKNPRPLLLPLLPSISPSLAPQPVFFFFFPPRSQGMGVGESGWVKSRTHEILKSFLGSPHQHMLLSSPLHFLRLGFFYFARSRRRCRSSHWRRREFSTRSLTFLSVGRSRIHSFIQRRRDG